MIQRLVEAPYFQHRDHPTAAQISFWLRELRTPELLIELARSRSALCRRLVSRRPLLAVAALGALADLEKQLRDEETGERERDKLHWQPLRLELERLHHARLK
jgi:hypothetical protein